MKAELPPPVRSTLKGTSNPPYTQGAWPPMQGDVNATELDVIEGKFPENIDGIYGRSTELPIQAPLGRYAPFDGDGVVNQHNQLVHYVPVPLPGPRLPHDMAFTTNYSILNDFPLFRDEQLLKKNVHFACLHPAPSRFSIIPRYGKPEHIRWFDAGPTYDLHFLNAYEGGGKVT